jgi:hypothetical protein
VKYLVASETLKSELNDFNLAQHVLL